MDEATNYSRGAIWMVDFGNPVGSELGMEHPAMIVSREELNNFAAQLGKVIVVPGTSTHFTNSKRETIMWHMEVPSSTSNGLKKTTYFMAEQVRCASIVRFRRMLGIMDAKHIGGIEDRLCFVMKLFR